MISEEDMIQEYKNARNTVFHNLGLDDRATRDLLNLYLKNDVSSKELSEFYAKYNFNELGYQCIWILARLSSKMHYEGVPASLLPRVKGVVRKLAVENGLMLCELTGVLADLNNAEIDVLLLKGSAMKAYYDPSDVRFMSDIDFLVHPEDVERAWKILEKRGFHLVSNSGHHIGCRKNEILFELHRVCTIENLLKGDSKSVWETALKTMWHGQKVFIPCPEVMLMILLVHAFRDAGLIDVNDNSGFLIKWVVDTRFFLDKIHINWRLFVKVVQENNFNMNVRIMLDILNRLYPGTITEDVLTSLSFTEKDIKNYRKLGCYKKASKQMREAKRSNQRLCYCIRGWMFLWYCSCFYGKRNSIFDDIIGFPHFFNVWNGQRGMKGLFLFIKERINRIK